MFLQPCGIAHSMYSNMATKRVGYLLSDMVPEVG